MQGQHNIWHFRHKHPNDVSGELSEWHKKWQREFDTTEVCFDKREGQIKARRADIVEGEYVVEIQHSSITKEEVDSRNKDYSLNQKKVILQM
jgi:competence CoiA-like predicted nuclease